MTEYIFRFADEAYIAAIRVLKKNRVCQDTIRHDVSKHTVLYVSRAISLSVLCRVFIAGDTARHVRVRGVTRHNTEQNTHRHDTETHVGTCRHVWHG